MPRRTRGDTPEHVPSAPQEDPRTFRGGRVIAAFPATGKSHFAAGRPGVIDSDSSSFSWLNGTAERHPDWPANYIEHIEILRRADTLLLVSTHHEVRAALVAAGIPFTLAYPTAYQLESYIDRMARRGSPAGFINLVRREWGNWLAECHAQTGCEHLVLGAGDYLSDYLLARRS